MPNACEVIKKFNSKFLSTLIGQNDKTINLCFRSETLFLAWKPIVENSNPSIDSDIARALTLSGSKFPYTASSTRRFYIINLSHLNIKLSEWIIRLYVVFMMKHYSRHYCLIKYWFFIIDEAWILILVSGANTLHQRQTQKVSLAEIKPNLYVWCSAVARARVASQAAWDFGHLSWRASDEE